MGGDPSLPAATDRDQPRASLQKNAPRDHRVVLVPVKLTGSILVETDFVGLPLSPIMPRTRACELW